jgi:hypothetical protein
VAGTAKWVGRGPAGKVGTAEGVTRMAAERVGDNWGGDRGDCSW